MIELTDLHVHSCCSDGTYTPTELVLYAKEKGLKAFALTDHDTILGIDEAMAAGKAQGVEVIPGIEFSTNYREKDIHVLGLGIDWKDARFLKKLREFQDSRDLRNRKMIARMADCGVHITYEKMQEAFPNSTWTRANFARYLVDHNYAKNPKEAFSRYVGDDAPCFVPREKVTPFQAVELIRENGGLSVLAHPVLYHLSAEDLDTLTARLKDSGLDGIEALYSTYRWYDETHIKTLARRHGLSVTGGSDFHGLNKPDIDLGVGRGNLKIPYALWLSLKARQAYR